MKDAAMQPVQDAVVRIVADISEFCFVFWPSPWASGVEVMIAEIVVILFVEVWDWG